MTAPTPTPGDPGPPLTGGARWLRAFYRLAFPAGYTLYLPRYLLRMRRRGPWRAGLPERFGRLPRGILEARGARPLAWLQAVSVGEAATAAMFVRRWQNRDSDLQFLVSTGTNTGRAMARARLPDDVPVVYFPADGVPFVRRALHQVRPRLLCLFESELWPTWIEECAARAVPVCVVNGRISPRAFERYQRIERLFAWYLDQVSLFVMQDEAGAERVRALGARPGRVRVAGSMKFDAAREPTGDDLAFARARFAEAALRGPVLLGASTHQGEERLLAEMLPRLRRSAPGLGLVLVPRHVERAEHIALQLRELGLAVVRRTELGTRRAGAADVLLVDSTGELARLITAADIVVIGKSFLARGGQNPIESAVAARATICGPHMENFLEVTRHLAAGGGLRQVAGGSELETAVGALLADPAAREDLGRRAQAAARAGAGAIDRTIDWVAPLLA